MRKQVYGGLYVFRNSVYVTISLSASASSWAKNARYAAQNCKK